MTSAATPPAPTVVRLGTRASLLAMTQSRLVARALEEAHAAAHPSGPALRVELVEISTLGDRSSAPLEQLGGTGVFVTAVRAAVLGGRCDVAVHSLKDLPTGAAVGLAPPVVPPRADPRDALCARDGLDLASLPAGAVVGTGAPRRRAALLAARPDLEVVGLRGNVDSRLARVGADLDAVILAVAGLARIDRLDAATSLLDPAEFPPAPGQGALAVEVLASLDSASPLAGALAAIDHAPTRLAVLAERAVLARLEAGCSAPVGAIGRVEGGRLTLTASAFAADGATWVDAHGSIEVSDGEGLGDPAAGADRAVVSDDDAALALGTRLADELLAGGARELAAPS
ncbi:MAG: hydroxymethylbilane synthase [Actinomycetales bacterium]|nr:hydroxymethylbilane synthase [Actinomycetales bacterium]